MQSLLQGLVNFTNFAQFFIEADRFYSLKIYNKMIYRLKIVSDEVNNFFREIEIDSEDDFLRLRNAILESVDYTKDEPSSFFLCDDDWTMHEEITQMDMGVSSDEDIWLMSDTKLSELLEEEGQKLMFVFDYLHERAFYMELKEIIIGKTLCDPLCTRKEGKAPKQKKQIEIDNITTKKSSSKTIDDLGLEFYGDTDFNEDELEGFDDLSL